MKIMVNSISPKDFYCVYNDFNVARKSQELNLLYLPLIGSDAVKLYQFLGTKILGDRNLSKNFLHYDIFDNLSLDSRKFTSSRKKLEALGLLSTYYIDNDGVGQYVYKLKDYLVQLFVNVRKQNIPTLDKMITRKIEEDSVELTEEDKFIKATDNTNYIDYLNKKMNLIISTVDAEAINKLQKKYNFPTGVLNILLEYSIKMSNSPGIPNFNYMDKIASTWSSKKLLGAKDAIEYVKERQTISNNRKNNSKQVKSTNSKNKGMYMAPFPEYLQKRKDTSSIENTTKNRTVTKEDEEAFSEMLKELNSKRDI